MLPKPTPYQYEWQEMERLAMLSISPATWSSVEHDDLSYPIEKIEMSHFDADQWCKAALLWGAREIVFVAKHVGGFCFWQTDTTEYSIKNTAFRGGKGDVLDDIYNACLRNGLKFGLYLSPADISHGAYVGGGGKTVIPEDQEKYAAIFRRQMTEILQKYPETFEVWFDGSIIIPVSDILEKYVPNAIILQGKERANIRWAGNEDAQIPYPSWSTVSAEDGRTGLATASNGTPDGDVWAPIEADVPLYNHYWFWRPEKEESRYSLDELMLMYYKSIGRSACMMLNICPNTDGLVPEKDMDRYEAFGKEIERRFSKPIGRASGKGTCLELHFDSPETVNHVILMENYQDGERVREFTVSAKKDGKWLPVVSDGSMIGRKQIFVFPDTEIDALRLEITKAVGEPEILAMEAYCVDGVDISRLCEDLKKKKYIFDMVGMMTLDAKQTPDQWSDLVVDVSRQVKKAGQYTIIFIPDNEDKFEIDTCVLVLEGMETEGLVSRSNGNSFVFTRSAAVDKNIGSTTKLRVRYRSDVPELRMKVYVNTL